MVEIRDRQVGGGGDVAHRGLGEAALAEDPPGGAEDRDPGGVPPALHPGGRRAAAGRGSRHK